MNGKRGILCYDFVKSRKIKSGITKERISMSGKFIDIDRTKPFMPSNMEYWLPEGHLARFIVDIVERLDLSGIHSSYSGLTRGQKAYPPAMMVALIFYCLVTGIFSSRKIEQATWESIPVRFITGNLHPDHDTIAAFRNRMKDSLDKIFIEILLTAQAMGVLKLGTVSLDGTKMKANASKHKAFSYGHACKLEEQLREEIKQLLEQSHTVDQAEGDRPGLDIPAEIRRREERLAKIEEAKKEIQKREQERYEREKAEYDEKMSQRAAKEERTKKKSKGKVPAEPKREISNRAQVNLTDEDSRIMPKSGGFEQSYNAQAGVDAGSCMIVNEHVTQACNDKQELEPALKKLKELPPELGTVEKILCDAGYYSEKNLEAAEAAGISPYIPAGRETHNEQLQTRMKGAGPAPEEGAGVVERTAHKLKTESGRKEYGKRKGISEPVFGIIKKVMGYGSFLTRGLLNVQKEWTLVCIGYNLKRLFTLLNLTKGVMSPEFKIMP
jgi:transposase